ncbi:MAG: hypothetical protein LBI26_02935 [Holosporales bacterium]|jgi:hypothetical protein|nr:hypothetical protein [Holosporales bacterium]
MFLFFGKITTAIQNLAMNGAYGIALQGLFLDLSMIIYEGAPIIPEDFLLRYAVSGVFRFIFEPHIDELTQIEGNPNLIAVFDTTTNIIHPPH